MIPFVYNRNNKKVSHGIYKMKDMDQIERGMTMKSRKWLWACMLGAALTAAGIMSVSAADHVVSSVTIRVSSKLEPGDMGTDSILNCS